MSGVPTTKLGHRSPAIRDEAPCARCAFDPTQRSGANACPYNSMYWDFLARHRERLEVNPRMRTIVKNLDRIAATEMRAITESADAHRATLAPLDPPWTFDEDAG